MGQSYPTVLSESLTIDRAISGENLARYGDGEFKLALGRKCISQPADKDLSIELRDILMRPPKGCLPCLPSPFGGTPRKESWLNFATPTYTQLLDMRREYGSAFVTRPDSAPWIDTPAYWNKIKSLWRGRNVTLVIGTQRSLRREMIESECASLRVVTGPSGQKGDGAYAKVSQIEEEIGTPGGPVIMCLGATATVLAARLARRGVHAIDLGHIGMFMRSAGAYRYQLDDLISPAYRHQLLLKHASKKKWGNDGAKHVEAVRAFAAELQPETILDYGCGRMQLAEAMAPVRVSGFDPGVAGKEGMPKPCDLLVCTDVLEHCELERLNNIFGHMHSVALKGAYVVIATRPAREHLADGRNAHLIVKPASWWMKGLEVTGWQIARSEIAEGREVRLWLKKSA